MQDRIARTQGMGWLPDYPDHRDFSYQTPRIMQSLAKVKLVVELKPDAERANVELPKQVDLRQWCSPVENQKSIGSCTAQAAAGIVEYFEKRAFGRYTDISRLFVYKTTRNLLGWKGDTGAFIRTTMGALVLFGAPPEKYWRYDVAKFDIEPSAFCYAYAQNYQAISYYRLDQRGTSRADLLRWAKAELAYGLPFMFGFTVYESIREVGSDGKISYPSPREKVIGGHAVMAVGYDDSIVIKNSSFPSDQCVGALLIKNSWGKEWGNEGYGWLPYKYVHKSLASDWWALIKNEWIDTGKFGI